MLFVAIGQHSPAQCPGHVKAVFDEVSASLPKIPELEKKHSVKLLGFYNLFSSHKTVIVMDAPSYDAAEMLLYDAGIMGWSTTELAQAHTPEEAMKMTAERFGVGG